MDVAIVRCTDTYRYNDIDIHEEVLAGYAASALEQAGISCKVFDLKLNPSISIKDVLAEHPKVVAFSVRHPGDNLFYVRQSRSQLNQFNSSLPHTTLFGHANVAIEENLQKYKFDSVILGEEPDLIGLVQAVINGSDYEFLPGIAFLRKDGSVHKSSPSPLHDLDKVPYPKRYYLDELLAKGATDPRVTITMQTSRGCYAACSFCFLESEKLARNGKYPWRARSLSNVINEIKHVISKYGVTDFYFYDTDFFGPGLRHRTRGEEFARLVLEEELEINFFLYTRATDLTQEGLSLLKQAGLTSVFIGIESFSQPVLDRYNKNVTVEQNLTAIELCKMHDIYIQTGYITYDYYTTFEELHDTIIGWGLALKDKAHLFPTPQFLFTLIAPLDGTPIGNHYKLNKIIDDKARYHFPSWIIPDLRMKSPAGSYKFKNSRIGELAECTRLLSYELAKKVVAVHKLLDIEVAIAESDEELEANEKVAGLVEWLSNLTLRSLEIFADMTTTFETDIDMYDGIEKMFQSCLRFYQEYLPEELRVLEIYDRHYMKLRQRSPGYVEESWQGLLATSST